MKRRLIKQGANALTVTLPKNWTEENNLKAGDEIDIIANNSSLIITTEKISSQSKIEIPLPIMDFHGYRHFLHNAYRRGFDEITLILEDSSQFINLRKVIDELLGFEITEQTSKKLVIKSVSVPEEKEYKTLFRRTFHIVSTAFAVLIEDINKQHFNSETMPAFRKDILRLVNFCHRILNKTSPQKSYTDYVFLTLNDSISNHFQQVYESVSQIKNVSKETKQYIERLKDYFELITKTIFTANQELLKNIISNKYQMYKLKKEILTKIPKKEIEIVQELGILLRLITEYVCVTSLHLFKENSLTGDN